jgi:hypothetical protein
MLAACVTSERIPSAAFTLLTAPEPARIRCRLYDDLAFASNPSGAIPLWEGDSVEAALQAAVTIGKKQRREDVTWRDLPSAGYRLPDAASIARVQEDFAARGLELAVVPSGD